MSGSEWSISDEVVQLRRRGTAQCVGLSGRCGLGAERLAPLTLGTDPSSDIHIPKASRLSWGAQALLFWREGQWHVVPSRGALLIDGIKTKVARLVPGTQVTLGSVTLVAESLQYIKLQSFLRRLLGWGWGNRKELAVEQAMRALREAQRGQLPVVLQGEGSLLPVAEEIHRRTLPASRAFIERRFEQLHPDSLRAALAAAAGGTLCLEGDGPAESWALVMKSARPAVQVVVCRPAMAPSPTPPQVRTISVPPLRTRGPTELAHLVRECFMDAALDLGLLRGTADLWPHPGTREELAWVMAHASATFADVLMATRQISAMRFLRAPPSGEDGVRETDGALVN
jgi:hypothetical protein